MDKRIKPALIAIAVVFTIAWLFQLIFIRTVNYEIAGVKIPSHYNILTGKVKPIPNYKGTANLPSITPTDNKGIGLSQDQTTIAQFRGALFSQWISAHREYKAWETDPEVFAKARAAFKEDMKKFRGVVVIQ